VDEIGHFFRHGVLLYFSADSSVMDSPQARRRAAQNRQCSGFLGKPPG